jgi:beta-propeller uncharacterized protein DUF5122
MKQLNGRGGVVRTQKWMVLVVACAVALVAAAAAVARGGVDRSFGTNGVVALDSLNRFGGMRAMETAPDRSIYLLSSSTRCEPTCLQELHLMRRHPDGSEDRAFGEGGVVSVAKGLGVSWVDELVVDAEGRALVVFPVAGGVSVVRVEPTGALDRSFGEGGATTLNCGCESASTTIALDRQGGIFIALGYRAFDPSAAPPDHLSPHLAVYRLLPDGSLDTRFGRAEVALSTREFPQVTVVRRDGSLVLAGSEESPAGLYLVRVRANGTVDHRFDRASHRALTRSRLAPKSFEVAFPGGLIQRPRGVVDVLGRTVYNGFALRVLPSGHLDRNFGRKGVKRLQWLISSAVPAGRGSVFGLGATEAGRTAAVLLNARASLHRAFHGGRPVFLPRWGSAELEMQGRRPLLFDAGTSACRGYCEPEPKLLRLTAPGFGR